jgi:Tfp pilus assembly protein PilN
MSQSVNLIPDQEVQEQTQKKVVKLSSLFSVLILIITSGVTAYFIYQTAQLSNQVKAEDEKIANLRSQIQGMSSIEITARNLGKKYTAIKELLGGRPYYSLLMEEFRARKPSEIYIRNFSILKDNKISITGQAQTYITITTFGNNLLSQDFVSGNPKLSGLFKSIILNQVDLSQAGTVDFSMTIDYDPSVLTYVQ